MKAPDYLSPDELATFTERSDLQGAWLVLRNWLLVGAIFTVVTVWTNPLTIVLGIVFLGGQQLGLSILMHEAGHKTLFKTQRLNELVGQWLCAFPVLGDCDAYAASHREHHRLAGTHDDPDLPNYENYPISKSSFKRKILRDVTGRTGIKLLAGLFSGIGNRAMMREGEGNGALSRGLLANAALFLLLWLIGVPALYLLWVLSYLTSYLLVARIRQLAEHGNVAALYDEDPRGNTRTTRANWLERLVFAPNNVNYHTEHHLLPSTPSWQLRSLHNALVAKGFYADHPHAVANSYWDVITHAVPALARRDAATT
ncbi:MAG: fatty acid desaturase family protein [Congregibacter sp.]